MQTFYTVMIIDDDPLTRESYEALLELEGLSTVAASNGAEAILWLESNTASRDFDIGLTTNGNWLAGGNENKGIPVTQTGIFGFSLFGSNLTTLDEASFVSELSNNPGGGGAQFFAVRFRGITIGAGSDKVPAAGGPETPIPEPGTLLLIGSGLVGLGAGAWRRKKH